MREVLYTINHQHAGKRLDIFLSEHTIHLTRSQIKKLINENLVQVNTVPARPSQRVKKGDVVAVHLQEPRKAEIEAENIPLDSIYEDEHIVVVNKPAGMVVHPAVGNYSGTLVNALLFHCSFLSGVGGVLRPGIVHRLDKGTSGVLVVAKNDSAHQSLSLQFKNRSVRKVYSALVYGKMEKDEGTIAQNIGRHFSDRKRMSTTTRKGRAAVTHWKVIAHCDSLSLLEVSIQTGRTHQIRVHFSSLNHPVVGDAVYSRKRAGLLIQNELLAKKIDSLKRPFLHARVLGFYHPHDNSYREFTAPLPHELQDIVSIIEKAQC